MILKVEDALKLLSRTDPESEAYRDFGAYSPLLAANYKKNLFTLIPRPLAAR